MRDLKTELALLKTCSLPIVRYPVDFAIEIMQRAVDAETESERLRLIEEKARGICDNCDDTFETKTGRFFTPVDAFKFNELFNLFYPPADEDNEGDGQ